MRKRIYLRVAKCKTGMSVKVENNPNHQAIRIKNYLPTILIALDLEIPDKEFDAARILLEAKIKETIPAVEIEQVGIKPEDQSKDQN